MPATIGKQGELPIGMEDLQEEFKHPTCILAPDPGQLRVDLAGEHRLPDQIRCDLTMVHRRAFKMLAVGQYLAFPFLHPDSLDDIKPCPAFRSFNQAGNGRQRGQVFKEVVASEFKLEMVAKMTALVDNRIDYALSGSMRRGVRKQEPAPDRNAA